MVTADLSTHLFIYLLTWVFVYSVEIVIY